MSLKTIPPIDDTDQIPGMEPSHDDLRYKEEMSVAVRNEEPAPMPRDSAQARVDAVASLLHNSYGKASTLLLTLEETTALEAPFQDSEFRTGAAGKENLIYLEHASIRERLSKVLGVGQWAIVVRNRWTETYQYWNDKAKAYKDANRVYVEAVLLVRGCFVGEAVGDMTYYPDNASTNFGDAVEGAKSAALRRCAKELGVGLQAWHKDFCEGWFRRRAITDPMERAIAKAASAPPKTPSAAPQATKAPETPEQRRERFLSLFRPYGDTATTLFRELNWILSTETFEDISNEQIDTMKKSTVEGALAMLPDDHGTTTVEVMSKDFTVDKVMIPNFLPSEPDEEPWRTLVTPFTLKEVPAGTPLGELDKKALWFWVQVWQPKEYTSPKNGKTYPPKEADLELYRTLQLHKPAIVAKYQFKEPKPL